MLGVNSNGELGTGDTVSIPDSQIPTLPNILFGDTIPAIQVSLGYLMSCALFANGKMRCWGALSEACGRPSRCAYMPMQNNQYVDIAVQGTSRIVQISAGVFDHTCVVFEDERVTCFGASGNSALGQDDNESKTSLSAKTIVFGMFIKELRPAAISTLSTSLTFFGAGVISTPNFTLQIIPIANGGSFCPSLIYNITLPSIEFNGSTVATGNFPPWSCGAGYYTVAFSQDGTRFSNALQLTIYDPDYKLIGYDASSPIGGPTLGGNEIWLTGSKLLSSTSALCRFGSFFARFYVRSSNSGYCVTPTIVTSGQAVSLEIALDGVTFNSSILTFYYYNVSSINLDVTRGPVSGHTPLIFAYAQTGDTVRGSNIPIVKYVGPGQTMFSSTGKIISMPTSSSGLAVSASTPPVIQFRFPSATLFNLFLSFDNGTNYYPSSTFEFYPDPVLIRTVPVSIPADTVQGVAVTLMGANLLDRPQSWCRVTFGSGSMRYLSVTADPTTGSLVAIFTAFGVANTGVVEVDISLNDQRQFTSNRIKMGVFVLSSIQPLGGLTTESTSVTATGSGFVETASYQCRINSAPSVLATYLTGETLKCIFPAMSITGHQAVAITADALHTTASSQTFLYYDPPVVSSIHPTAGPSETNSSWSVTLFGSGFVALSPVCSFGPAAQTPGLYVSSSSMSCLIPPGFGTVVISIALNGVNMKSTAQAFSYFSVTDVIPLMGIASGGTRITITGTGFGDHLGFQCRFGTFVFANIERKSSQSIICVTEAVTSGVVTVGVSVDGFNLALAPFQFTFFTPPNVTAVFPRSSYFTGGASITLFGTDFPVSTTISCFFDRTDPKGTPNGPNEIVCTSPSGAKSVPLGLTFNGIDITRGGSFSFFSVSSVVPLSGPVFGGTILTWMGDGFTDEADYYCSFDKIFTIATFVNENMMTCSSPPFESSKQVQLSLTTDKASFSPSLLFSPYSAPVISNMFPLTMPASGGNITLRGTEFIVGSACYVGVTDQQGSANTVSSNTVREPSVFVDSTLLICSILTRKPGRDIPVFVSNNDQQLHLIGFTMNFTSCARGTYAPAGSDAVCQSCEPGTYAPDEGSTKCIACPSTSYTSMNQSVSCVVCPNNTQSINGRDSLQTCVCTPNFYHPRGETGKNCTDCPDNGVCLGGVVTATPKPGFWASSQKPFIFVPCPYPQGCSGGKLEACSEGYTGSLCAKCDKGYFKTGSGCKLCPPGSQAILVAAILFAFGISILLIKGFGKSARNYSGTIGIATKFFQVLAVLGKLEVRWPPNIKNSISVLTAPFSLKLDSLAPECSAPSFSYTTKWIVTMLFPLIFALIFVLIYGGAYLKASYHRSTLTSSFGNRVINGYILLISLGYLTLASTAIEPFGCKKEIDGSYTMLADPSLKCGDRWWKNMLPFSILGIILYLIGIPLGLFAWLRAHRTKLSDPQFVERYGGLFSSFVPGLPYWESFVMMEKILIASTGILVRQNVALQIVLLQVIFVGSQSIYTEKRPFVRGKDNRLETTLRWCSILVLFAGLLFVSGNLQPDTHSFTFFEIFTVFLIVFGTLVVVVSVIWNLVHIHRLMRVKLSPEMEQSLSLFSPYGAVVITRWLKQQPTWQPIFQNLLLQFMSVSGIKSLESKQPRRDSLSIEVQQDPAADAVIATFTGGVFRDDLVPFVRTWLASGTGEHVPHFISAFTAIGLTTSISKNDTHSQSSVEARITRASVRNISILAKTDGKIPAHISKARDDIIILYGSVAPSKMDAKQWGDPRWLMNLHQLYMHSVELLQGGKLVLPQDIRQRDIANDIEIEMSQFSVTTDPCPTTGRALAENEIQG